ncbi:AAEL006403-PA [Aedes aegypti]|uniref:trypsin n=2 Tax=Aedes aegypti TaxID=7159 RepID=A0A1S4FDG6_AEDAE|nr:trypsin-7 [Aedes aegypti]EAT42003.1 AAEL006403-PA [Aedes aegypti]
MLRKVPFLLLVVIFHLLLGIIPPSAGIVGGYPEEIETTPWMVSISVQNVGLICGGVIVSPRVILTAAYCVYRQRPMDLIIRVGSKFTDRDGYTLYPENVITHSAFNATNKENNLALLTLSTVLRESHSVFPIRIKEATDFLPLGTQCIISGYGSTDPLNPQSFSGLRSAMVRTMDRDNCAQRLYPWTVTYSMLCASGNGEDGCAGDAGGPLICGGKLTAIISWGKGCGREGGIGVYADLTSARRWLTDYGVP